MSCVEIFVSQQRRIKMPPPLKKRCRSSDSTAASTKRKVRQVQLGFVTSTSTTIIISSDIDDDNDDDAYFIPRQNKGVCTACDVMVWIVTERNALKIKWCKGCKNLRPWLEAFGSKGSATKCIRCRDRQKEKYALQKSIMMSNNKSKPNSTMTTKALLMPSTPSFSSPPLMGQRHQQQKVTKLEMNIVKRQRQ